MAPGCVRVSPPGSASAAGGRTSRPSARPPRSSAAAAGSAVPPHRSRWRSERAGPRRSADLQELTSWDHRRDTGRSSLETETTCVSQDFCMVRVEQ